MVSVSNPLTIPQSSTTPVTPAICNAISSCG
jgi:hypothetical protein